MRLFVTDSAGHQIYLAFPYRIERRVDIPPYFTVVCSICGQQTFHNSQVQVEPEANSAVGGAVLGGIVGVLGGPLGVILGAGIGSLLGTSADAEEQRRIRNFG